MLAFAIILVLVMLAIAIGIYVALAMFLNNYNKLLYNKGTACAWIPICNIYLLGKLVINKTIGYILVVIAFLTANYTVTVNDISRTYTILPTRINNIITSIYSIFVLCLLIYGILKYNKLKENAPKQN